MAAQLHIHTQDLRGCVIARPVGEVDLSNASTLEGRLCGLIERGHLVVDLSQAAGRPMAEAHGAVWHRDVEAALAEAAGIPPRRPPHGQE